MIEYYDPTKPHTPFIIEQMKRTWNTSRCKVHDGTYPIIQRNFSMLVKEVDHTDGIGTKGILHWKHRTFRSAVQDALAMNINDLTMCRATPYKLQNHIIIPKDDKDAIVSIITALADECIHRDIAITGGETSVHEDQEGLEISITMSGWMERIYPNLFIKGHKLIGLSSFGMHSNGFTALRHMMPTDEEMQKEWLAPTRIYQLPNQPLSIVGIQHITGGAFDKLKHRLDKNTSIYIHRNHTLEPHKVFFDLYKHYMNDVPMYKTFNCGIGMVLGVNKQDVNQVISEVGGEVIGEVIEGNGEITIESKFSNNTVKL